MRSQLALALSHSESRNGWSLVDKAAHLPYTSIALPITLSGVLPTPIVAPLTYNLFFFSLHPQQKLREFSEDHALSKKASSMMPRTVINWSSSQYLRCQNVKMHGAMTKYVVHRSCILYDRIRTRLRLVISIHACHLYYLSSFTKWRSLHIKLSQSVNVGLTLSLWSAYVLACRCILRLRWLYLFYHVLLTWYCSIGIVVFTPFLVYIISLFGICYLPLKVRGTRYLTLLPFSLQNNLKSIIYHT